MCSWCNYSWSVSLTQTNLFCSHLAARLNESHAYFMAQTLIKHIENRNYQDSHKCTIVHLLNSGSCLYNSICVPLSLCSLVSFRRKIFIHNDTFMQTNPKKATHIYEFPVKNVVCAQRETEWKRNRFNLGWSRWMEPEKKQGINLEYEIQPNTHFPAYKTHERARSHMCAV